jgi:hypothetical protein
MLSFLQKAEIQKIEFIHKQYNLNKKYLYKLYFMNYESKIFALPKTIEEQTKTVKIYLIAPAFTKITKTG